MRCQADIALVLSLPRISAASLKNLLLYCFMHPLYLSTPEGQRTLVFVIGLHVPFFDQIYATLRNQIPGASKAALAAIGDILFRAWRDADGVLLQKIGSSWSAHAHECSCCQTVLTLLPAPAPRAAPPRPLSSPAPRPLPSPALRALSRPPRPAPALRVRSCDCIEYVCLQDLMNHAVHAQANNADAGGMSMAARLRRILSAFHEKKNQPGVRGGRPRKCGNLVPDAHCWSQDGCARRSTRCSSACTSPSSGARWASRTPRVRPARRVPRCRAPSQLTGPAPAWIHGSTPAVRRNAAALMIDAFPISEPGAKVDDLDQQMQRQFDALEVRASA